MYDRSSKTGLSLEKSNMIHLESIAQIIFTGIFWASIIVGLILSVSWGFLWLLDKLYNKVRRI